MGSLRITGMATGMDTDATIKQMMKPYNMRVDKMKQDRQIVAWRQELYRDILSDTATMTKTFFDVLKSDTYMLSKNNYAGFDVTAANSVEGQSAGVSATASVGAATGNYKVEVLKLATAAKLEGTAINQVNISDAQASVDLTGKNTVQFSVAGTQVTIDLNTTHTNTADLINDIKEKIEKEPKLSGKISVEQTAAGIKFNSLTYESIKIDSINTGIPLDDLKGKVLNPNKYMTKLGDVGIGDDGKLTLQYRNANGVIETKDITIDKDNTISQLKDLITKETSGNVILDFSELTGKFNIECLQTGTSSSLKVTESGTADILTSLGLGEYAAKAEAEKVVQGQNAKVTITPPGAVATTIEKSGNSFSIDGINYTLSAEGTTNITVKANSQKTYDKIKGFIDKYNELVDKVSQKIDEKKQYKYLPLTDDQKKDMKEDEIKQWESRAKEGLLKGDSNLDNMLNTMRRAFFGGVEGAGISLSEIGLTTSPDTTQRGKILIDEQKLKTAIETRGEQIAELFTKTSTTHSSYSPDYTSSERSVRNKEEGIFQRINDILQDYTRTRRDKNSKKGILLEKAGIKGDTTEFKSLLSEDIIKKDEKINEMIKNLAVRENNYYLQFSKLESAMNKMNSQTSWLAQQFGGGQ